QELRAPAPGQSLLTPDIVLIPQVAMRRWLQAGLARVHGIAANLEFLTPGELVRRALDANVDGAGEDLDADALRWRLLAALGDPALMRAPAMAGLRRYLADGDALKAWGLAGELAAVFEKYQAWRRDWLLEWEDGGAPRDPQAMLWRHVGAGRRHRARRIDDYLRRFGGDNAPRPAGLPPRLFAFATLNISPDVLRVVASQARVGTLHFYLPSPTQAYWGDLQTLRERLQAGARQLRGGAPVRRRPGVRRAGTRAERPARRRPAQAAAARPVPSPGGAGRTAARGRRPWRPDPAGARLPHAPARGAGAARP